MSLIPEFHIDWKAVHDANEAAKAKTSKYEVCTMETFEDAIKSAGEAGNDTRILRVTDTAALALAWLDQHRPGAYTTADVLKLTEMYQLSVKHKPVESLFHSRHV